MTIEEKAKAYDKVLERAQKAADGGMVSQNFVDGIFQLRESEDEKIRKVLIHIVQGACDKYGIKYRGEISEEKLLAYLEKQKEQKTLSTEELELNSLAFLEQMGYTCIPPGKGQKSAECISDSVQFDEGFKTGREVGFREGVKSVKSAEWSKEDENRFRNLIYLVERSEEGRATKEGFISFINRLKSLHPQPHWKPSEEQMKALLNADGLVRAYNYPENAKIIASLYEQLKKL